MAVVTISRGSFSKGREVAEGVAESLGYKCISRDVLIEASEEYDVPEVRLVRAIHDAPSILDRFSGGKERYIAYLQAVLLEHCRKDNVVYHGLAGHFVLRNIGHVLKVRIIAEMEDRVRLEMEREGIPRDKALRVLKNDDEERRKWSRWLYGISTDDPSLYDVVIHIKRLSVSNAVDTICHCVQSRWFQTTEESQRAMDDLFVEVKAKAALIDLFPHCKTTCKNGLLKIILEQGDAEQTRSMVKGIPGVDSVQVKVRELRRPRRSG